MFLKFSLFYAQKELGIIVFLEIREVRISDEGDKDDEPLQI